MSPTDAQQADELRQRLDLMDRLEQSDQDGTDSSDAIVPDSTNWTLKGLNIVPGATRAAIQTGMEATGLKPPSTTDGTPAGLGARLRMAIHGEYPPSSQIYNVDPVTGFVGDVAQDPTGLVLGGLAKGGTMAADALDQAMTGMGRMSAEAAREMPTSSYESLGSRLGKLFHNTRAGLPGNDAITQFAGSPVGTALEKGGAAIHGSRLGALDGTVNLPGMPEPTDLMLKAGIAGRAKNIAPKIQARIDQLENLNDEIISKASSIPNPAAAEQGTLPGIVPPPTVTSTIDMADVTKNTRDWLEKNYSDPAFLPLKNSLEPTLAAWENQGKIPLNQAVRQWRELKALSQGAYSGEEAGIRPQLYQKMRQSMADGIGEAISEVSPKAAALYKQNRMEMGSLINAMPEAEKMGQGSILQDLAGDAAAGGLGLMMGHSPRAAMTTIALKRAVQSLISPFSTTNIGLGLNRLGQAVQSVPGAEGAIRQSVLRMDPPWLSFPPGGSPQPHAGQPQK